MAAADDPLSHLLDAAAEGDSGAFGELVRATQPTLWRLCTMLGDPGDEADLVQETYLRAMRSLHTYRRDASVTVWLLAIARNVCADEVRRRQRRRRLLERLQRDTAREHTARTGDYVEDLLAGLDVDRRNALVLTQYLGLSYEEAAAVLGCPIGTIRSRVARARSDIAAALSEAEAR